MTFLAPFVISAVFCCQKPTMPVKKLIVSLSILFLSSFAMGQTTCEQREAKLLEGFGSFSAGLLYNTYGVIGSISDGYMHDAYNAESATNLLDAQKRLMDNLVKVLEDLKAGSYLSDQTDIDYATSAAEILKGLKTQAQLMTDYIKTNSASKQSDYSKQREKNWKQIAKLMGIEE
jgi:hypothetical protein